MGKKPKDRKWIRWFRKAISIKMEKSQEISYLNYSRRLPNVDILIIFIFKSIIQTINNLTYILALLLKKKKIWTKIDYKLNPLLCSRICHIFDR